MREAQHDVHVVAWVLALQGLLGDKVRQVRGPRSGYLAPPWRTVGGERHDYGPDDLRLPGGRTPHGFLRTDQGRRTPPIASATASPDCRPSSWKPAPK